MTMLRIWLSALALVLLGLPAIGQEAMEAEEERAWSLDIGLDYASLYMFRGIDLLGDDPVFIPYVTFGYGGLTVWAYGYEGDFGSETDIEGDPYSELDFGLDYTWGFGLEEAHYLTLGALRYTYSDPPEYEEIETNEVYAILGFGTSLAPTLTLYYDVDVYDAGYLSLGVSHSWPLGESASFDAAATLSYDLGYNSTVYLGDEQNDLSDLLLNVDVPLSITEGFAVHAGVSHSIALAVVDDIGQDDETWFTVGGSYSF